MIREGQKIFLEKAKIYNLFGETKYKTRRSFTYIKMHSIIENTFIRTFSRALVRIIGTIHKYWQVIRYFSMLYKQAAKSSLTIRYK